MARKKRTGTSNAPLPLSKGEIWEIGRRPLSVHVLELEERGERPEIFLAVQAGEAGGVVLAEPVTSAKPVTALVDFTLQAMQQPLIGPPRRPEIIRIASRPEAESLAVALAGMGLALEVCSTLQALDVMHADLEREFSGVTHDYRTQAGQAGEILSEAGLHAFFRTSRQFYRAEIWKAYSDDTMFELAMERASGPAQTYYGILMGSMGTEFGIALYPSLQSLEQFYAASLQHMDHLEEISLEEDDRRQTPGQLQHDAAIVAQFTQIPSLTLTYTLQSDVPSPLLQEARQLKLPIANKSAFPLVVRMGDQGFHIATATELVDMFSALHAILDWDAHIDEAEGDDEIDITITSHLPAVAGFTSAVTIHTTLRNNPYLPEEEDFDPFDADLDTILAAFSQAPERSKPAATGKKASQKASPKKTSDSNKKGVLSAAAASHVYTFAVQLVDGPMSPAHAKRNISRHIAMLGSHTLHEFHEAIFQAFGRQEEHVYEFNLGTGPMDRSQVYSAYGEWNAEDEDAIGNTATTPLHALDLKVGRRFGYVFDMGDNWAHVIEVVSTVDSPGKGKYPRVVKKMGPSPPQYPDGC